MATLETRIYTQLAVSGGTLGAYLVFYSGYSKATKSLALSKQLGPILSFRNVKFSLRELNKILALAGMTLAGASLLCNDSESSQTGADLRKSAAGLLVAHSTYSQWFSMENGRDQLSKFPEPLRVAANAGTVSFYDLSLWKIWLENKRWIGILMGQGALLALLAESKIAAPADAPLLVPAAAMTLGLSHFVLMEIKPGPYNGSLAVRPFGYLGAVAGVAGLFSVGLGMLRK